MGKPCRVTFGDHVFFKDDFIHRMLDTLHLDDTVVDSSPYLKSIEYDNSFREGDPMLIRKKVAEAAPVVEEQYQPITIKDITHDRFSKDNAMDYEEDEKESDSGRVSTYISSMTIETTDGEGNTNGALVKLTDEDGIVSWNAEDMDGNELSYDGFDTKDEAKQAIADAWNKEKKKEFDKEAKKAAKKKQKAQAAAPQPTAAAPKAPSIFTDLDATNKRGGLKAQQEAKKSFKEKYGNAADVAKAISANFEAIADELKSKDVFTEIDCK